MTAPQPATPVRYGSRDGSDPATTAGPGAGRPCPVCQTGHVSARARYCSDACKQRAYRLRQASRSPADLDLLTAALRRRLALVTQTVYECPTCEARLLGERRCPDCHIFCRRLGLGGRCPHCDEPVILAELLGPEEVLPSY